jgi:hypothetical protein
MKYVKTRPLLFSMRYPENVVIAMQLQEKAQLDSSGEFVE